MFLLLLFLWARVAVAASTVGDPVATRSAEALQLYQQQSYQEALQVYRDALVERPGSAPLHLNVGDALHQLGDFVGAAEEFEHVAHADDPDLASQGFFNLGNSRFQLQDYGAAAKAYREALSRRPYDADAKANLELALQKMQQPPPQEGGKASSAADDAESDPADADSSPGGEPSAPNSADAKEDDAKESGSKDDKQGAQKQEQPESTEPPQPAPEVAEDKDDLPASASADSPTESKDDALPQPVPDTTMDESEAKQLLDALADQEQEGQKRRFRTARRGAQERDW